MKNFRNLIIWQKSRVFVKKIYVLSQNFPPTEKYGLSSQIQRAAISIPSNIAEGCGRQYNKELIQFLYYSISSACEVETQLFLASDLNYISEKLANTYISEVIEIRKMILGYIKSIEKK